jgi:hypothetical protein
LIYSKHGSMTLKGRQVVLALTSSSSQEVPSLSK